MGRYSLAKFDYPGKNLLDHFILATIMVPFTAILIPLFLIIHGLGWMNTYQVLIVPFTMSAFAPPSMRQSTLCPLLTTTSTPGASTARMNCAFIFRSCSC